MVESRLAQIVLLGNVPHYREDVSAKFWPDPVVLAYNLGYPPRELRKLEAIITEHQRELLEAWNEYFGTASG